MTRIRSLAAENYYDDYANANAEPWSDEQAVEPGIPRAEDEFILVDNQQFAPEAWQGMDAQFPDGELAELSQDAGVSELKEKIQSLLAAIFQDSKLIDAVREEFQADMETLQAQLDLDPQAADEVGGRLEEIKEAIGEWRSFPEAVQRLAKRANLSPEEMADSFQRQGLKPEALPTPLNSGVWNVLREHFPSLSEAADRLNQSLEDKKAQDQKMVEQARERNAQAVMSNRDTDSLDLSSYEYLLKAQTGGDVQSRNLQQCLNDFRDELTTILEAVNPNGLVHLTDEALWNALHLNPPEVPELVPMAIDGKGRGRYERFDLPLWVKEYPLIEYNGSYRGG